MPTGILALLDLPVGTSLTIDGKSTVLKRDDFVALDSITSPYFHLAIVQAPPSSKMQSLGAPPRHGFVLIPNDNQPQWIIAHRYNPVTEEVDPEPVDSTTCCNLEMTIRRKQLDLPRVIPYARLLSDAEQSEWKQATSFIDSSLLLKRKVSHGDKIVPGAYVGGNTQDNQQQTVSDSLDGRHLFYPPIPVLGDTPLRHVGTKAFLSRLSPSQRTKLLMEGPSVVLAHLIETYYSNDWRKLLGDVQLAYALFLHMHCLSSLEHWRDLVTMTSLAATKAIDETFIGLFSNFTSTLQLQIKYMDKEFFDDTEFSGDNFLLSAVTRLVNGLQASNNELLQRKAAELSKTASTVFTALAFQSEQVECDAFKPDQHSPIEEEHANDDRPIVVSVEEFEASLARSTESCSPTKKCYPPEHRRKYPLLFASIQPHEDVLMACSRALDTHTDVSLVREAAAYLEEVEAYM